MSLPTLTLLNLRAQARSKSGVSASDYSNTELDRQLNIGYIALATMLINLGEDYFEEQNVKFDLIANSGLYSLPTDLVAFKQLRLAFSGTPLSPSAYTIATSYDPVNVHDIASQEEQVPVSNPIYDLTSNYMRIKPKPTVAVTNGGRLDYIALPSALVNTGDIPVIPARYQDKIAVYGAKEMAFKFEKWQKHDRLSLEWNGTMGDLEEKLAERDTNAPSRFMAPQEAGYSRRNREL